MIHGLGRLGEVANGLIAAACGTYTAVSTKVVQKKRKSVRDNAERSSGKYSINFK